MVEGGAEREGGEDLTIDEFLALLRYINDKVELLSKELARYQRHSRRLRMSGEGFEDLMKAIIVGSLAQTQPQNAIENYVDEEELREKARRLARKLAGNVSSGK